jgi:hypothetical protein
VDLPDGSTISVNARFELTRTSEDQKVLFVGICGAAALGSAEYNQCLAGEGWFDPRWVDELRTVNPLNEDALSALAKTHSGIIAAGLRIGTEWPNSIVTIADFDAPYLLKKKWSAKVVVDELIAPYYNNGDLVVLMGHSVGGAMVQSVVDELAKRKFPVLMAGWIDAVGTSDIGWLQTKGFDFDFADIHVPANVTRAFNFVYIQPPVEPRCFVSGESTIVAEKKNVTSVISNTAVPDPEGVVPGGDPCDPHRQMDNDSRVWTPMLNYVLGTLRGPGGGDW